MILIETTSPIVEEETFFSYPIASTVCLGIKGIRSFNHQERALQGGFASEKWILVAMAISKDGIITALWRGMVHSMSLTTGLVVHMIIGGLSMTGIQGIMRSYEEEYPIERESRRHERPYFDSYHDMDAVLDRDGYHNIETYRDHKFDRASRFGEQDHDDYAYDDYDYKSRTSYRKMGDSCERDYEYGRHSYDSDYERGRRRDGNWRRRESHDREHLGPLEVEVNRRTAMMMADMRGMKGGTVKTSVALVIMTWLRPQLLL
ncbi:hypothetical protein OIU77_001314 [Salix suchowensis]|uniref:Uncharacterized protein n=1 Tax=Salix suchowensis TaxID=1278906 RepID=A0ABQ9B104_9ROSI|nr:hypothetical protein OIU77_001314 [Salix suchowensis]